MLRYERVKGLPIITTGEGVEVGRVDELIVDPDRAAVSWLRIQAGGFRGEKAWVPVEAVQAIGEDAVTIGSDTDVRRGEEGSGAEALVETGRRVIGNQVVTDAGRRLGEVRDYEFRPGTFALSYLHIPPGMDILGQFVNIAAEKVMKIGVDAIVVKDDAVVSVDEAATVRTTNAPA